MTEQTSQNESTNSQTDAAQASAEESTALGGAEQVDDPNKQREGEDAAQFAERLKKQKEATEGGDKDGGDKEAAVGAPERYELAVPDGFEKLDEAMVAEAEPVLRELNLSNEAANKLVPVVAAAQWRDR
jgi:hypothetical protein